MNAMKQYQKRINDENCSGELVFIQMMLSLKKIMFTVTALTLLRD